MKEKIVGCLMALFMVLFFSSICLAADESGAATNWKTKNIKAKVTAIDVNASEITLKDNVGNEATFVVDKQVANLGEFAVGNKVKAEFYISMASDVHKPTAEEKKKPFVELDEKSTLPPKASPDAKVKMFQAVVTVLAWDPGSGVLYVKGPKGKKFWLTPTTALKQSVETGNQFVVKYSQPYITSITKLK
jgi:hypothetical protein